MVSGLRNMAFMASFAVMAGNAAVIQVGPGDPTNSGSSGVPSLPWSSTLKTAGIENSFYSPSGSSGKILHNVNLLTGQPVYSVPIAMLSAGGVARIPISFTYSGSVRPLFDADNEKGPTSWIGYGWNFTVPFIAVNHKGTVSISDDVYFCNLGPYGGGQLLRNANGSFFVAGDPTIQITGPELGSNGTPVKWTFKWPGGLRMRFGSGVTTDPCIRTIKMAGGILTGSPYSSPYGTDFAYRWDVARIDDYRTDDGQGNESIDFSYEPTFVALAAGKYYTRESYVKDIIHKNRRGNEIEKYSFILAGKDPSEYHTSAFEPGMGQSVYETKRLLAINRYVEGSAILDRQYSLYAALQAGTADAPYPKRFLTALRVGYKNPLGFMLTDDKWNWTFAYAGPAHHHALKTIDKPFVGRDEFEYANPVYNTSAWMDNVFQEGSVRQMKRGDGSVIDLTSHAGTQASLWENQTSCTESFCFTTLLERKTNDLLNYSDLLHFSVWRNNGTYFKNAKDDADAVLVKTVSSIYDRSLSLIPWNDNFILLDSKAKKLWLYEWDGRRFNVQADLIKRENPANTITTIAPYAAGSWSVTLGPDFFVVKENAFKNPCTGTLYGTGAKMYVVRKTGGIWADYNQRECIVPSECIRTDPASGPWTSGPGCLEFNTQNMMVSTGLGLLQIAPVTVNGNASNSNIFTWTQNASGSAFAFISNLVINGKLTKPIQYGKDYFLLNYVGSLEESGTVAAYSFNGQAISYITGYSQSISYGYHPPASQVLGFAGGDYFISIDRTLGRLNTSFWKKSVTRDANQNPTGFTFTSTPVFWTTPGSPSPVLPQEPTLLTGGEDIRVRTHPNAFSLEVYPAGSLDASLNTAPPVSDGNNPNNYATFILEVDPALPSTPLRNVSGAFKDANNRNLFDVSFSYPENSLLGTSCAMGNNVICSGNNFSGMRKYFSTATITPGRGVGSPFFRSQSNVYTPWTTAATYSFSQFRMSNASSMGAISMLNSATNKAEFMLLQWMGLGFTRAPYEIPVSTLSGDITYVKNFKSTFGITGPNWGHWTEHGFQYGTDSYNLSTGKAEYNSLLRGFLFPYTSITTYKGSTAVPVPVSVAVETANHIIDDAATQLPDNHIIKQGIVTKTRLHDVAGAKGAETLEREMTRIENEYYDPAGDATWPSGLYILRPKSTTTTQWASNLSRRVDKVSFNNYYALNNRPLFIKRKAGNDWFLTQTLFRKPDLTNHPSDPNPGVAFGGTTYRFSSEPADATLNAWSQPDQPFTANNTTEKTVAAWERELDYSFPFMAKKRKGWRDTDPSLNDNALKSGTEPVHLRSEGWEELAIIDKWNKAGQPLESRTLLSSSVERRTAFFYEGRGSLLVGKVANSYLEDAAILTAENGNLTLTNGKHDWEDRWTAYDAGYSSDVAHTGRWSIKVADNYGPTIDLKLKGVTEQGYDYIVSAWAYSENVTKPLITAQLFSAANSPSATYITQDPVGEAFVSKKWQRYEIRISNAQLKGGTRFLTNNSGDYLRVKVGTGAPGSGSTKITYVDDIVCRSSQSLVNLSAYDGAGRIINATTNDNVTSSFEYDLFGRLSATRDDQNRIFSSTSSHEPGEND